MRVLREIGKLLVPPQIGERSQKSSRLCMCALDNARDAAGGPVRFVQQRSGLMPKRYPPRGGYRVHGRPRRPRRDPPEPVDHLNAPAHAPVSRPRPAVLLRRGLENTRLPPGLADGMVSCPSGEPGAPSGGTREPAPVSRIPVSPSVDFTIEREVEHDLIPVGEEIVQSIDLGSGARERSASVHHVMKIVVMLLGKESHQHRNEDTRPRSQLTRYPWATSM